MKKEDVLNFLSAYKKGVNSAVELIKSVESEIIHNNKLLENLITKCRDDNEVDKDNLYDTYDAIIRYKKKSELVTIACKTEKEAVDFLNKKYPGCKIRSIILNRVKVTIIP